MTRTPEPISEDLPGPLENELLSALDRRRQGEGLDAILARFSKEHPTHATAIRQLGDDFRAAEDEERAATARAHTQPDGPGIDQIAHFRILERLGIGGMGAVYRAEDTRLRRQVALKLLQPHALKDPATRQRFEREMLSASRLQHPNICAIHEVGEVDGEPFMAMELIEGRSLAQHLAARRAESPGRLPTRDEISRVIDWIETAARALHFAHDAGLVHRDIKPGNLMLAEPSDTIVVLDFGLVRDERDTTSELTASTDQLGTPRYMAPEQVYPRGRTIDHRTDIYALGVTLFELLTLESPFVGGTRVELFDAIRDAVPVRARQRNDAIPRDLGVVLACAMDRDPDRRYDSAEELAEDLARVRRHEPIRARRASLGLRLVRWCQRNPVAASGMALLTVALAVTAVLGSGWRTALAGERAARTALVESRSAERRQEAATYFERGSAALDRGEHALAMRAFEDAQRLGYPDEIAVTLGLVESLEVLTNSDAAGEMLAPLAAQSDADLGPHAAQVRLHQGYAALSSDESAAVELFKRSLTLAEEDGNLAPADIELARAMIAPDVPGLIEHLDRAIEADPRHLLARMQLGVAEAVRGNPGRTLEIARTMRLLAPDADESTALEAFALAILDRVDEARAAIAAADWDPAQQRMFEIGVEIMENMHAVCEKLIRSIETGNERVELPPPADAGGLTRLQFSGMLLEFLAAIRTIDTRQATVELRLAPQIGQWFQSWSKSTIALALGNTDALDKIQSSGTAHGGTSAGIQIAHAQSLKYGPDVDADSARAYLERLDPCSELRGFEWGMPTVRRLHAHETIEALYFIVQKTPKRAEQEPWRVRMVKALQDAVRLPGTTEHEFYLHSIYANASADGLVSYLDVIDRWSQAFPKSPEPWFQLGKQEHALGGDRIVANHCYFALRLDPDHAEAKALGEKARARLLENRRKR